MRFILHKVVASHVTDNFKRGQRYVVNYKLPEQPVQMVNELVLGVTDSSVLFETQTIPKDSILNVCFLLSLPSELLRLAVSFLDPATQCAIAPTSSLLRNSVNEQQSSPKQRRLDARHFIQPLATSIENSILRDREDSTPHAIRCVESRLNKVEPTIRPFVFLHLSTRSAPWIREVMDGFIQRQNDPVVKLIQDIEAHVLRTIKESDSTAVKNMEGYLNKITDIPTRNLVRESLRHSCRLVKKIEKKLTEREQNPTLALVQDIEHFVALNFNNKQHAVNTMEYYLKQADPAIRDAVRQGLKEQGYKTQRIEALLTDKEMALSTQNLPHSLQTNFAHLGG